MICKNTATVSISARVVCQSGKASCGLKYDLGNYIMANQGMKCRQLSGRAGQKNSEKNMVDIYSVSFPSARLIDT